MPADFTMRDRMRLAMQGVAAVKISHFDADAMISAIFEMLRVPTPEMISAGEKAQQASMPIYDYNTADIWAAMLAEAKK
jgi:hypothetical protein